MRLILLSVVGFAVSACTHHRPVEHSGAPVVLLEYGYLLDRECTHKRPPEEFAAVRQEIRERLAEFQADWNSHGTRLLQTAAELIQVPSPFNEVRPALISCGLPSMSAPVLINVRHHISAGGGEDWPEGHGMNNLIFHELLHRYVVAALDKVEGRTTPLLEKYKDEESHIRNHLHLYAIEQATYEALGLSEVLEAIKNKEKAFPSWPPKEAALSIVSKETSAAFIDELRRPQ